MKAAILLALSAAVCLGCGRGATAPAERRPSILLVTIDTWRSDAIGVSGSGRTQTPRLDALARDGVYIPKVQTTCPLTTPAHATILTGLVPYHHGMRDNLHFRLNPDAETLAARLSRAGYHTAAVVSGAPLRKIYGLDRGFAAYDDSGLLVEPGASFDPAQRRADRTTDLALAALAGAPPQPIFLWVHYYDPHFPYDPPEPYRSRFASDRYAGEVAFVDGQLGRLLDGLPKERGRTWTILVTGDHGEGLGEHGEETHGVALYEPTLQVPLVLSPRPAGFAAPKDHVGLVDVAPTLAGLAGLDSPGSDGADLLRSGITSERELASESANPATSFRVNPVLSIRKGDLIWFHHGADEVYDLTRDPSETTDLSASEQGRRFIAELSGSLVTFFGADPVAAIADRMLALPSEQLVAMRSLGYVGGGARSSPLRAVDIRTFLTDVHAFDLAGGRIRRGDAAGALDALREIQRRYPDAPMVWREIGFACIALSDLSGARQAFRTALELDATDAISALNLGNLHAMAGEVAAAERLYLRSLDAEENQAEGHLNLGLLYAKNLGRPADAAVHLRRFLDLAPGDAAAPEVRALLATLPAAPGAR